MSLNENIENHVLKEYKSKIKSKLIRSMAQLKKLHGASSGSIYGYTIHILQRAFEQCGTGDLLAPRKAKVDGHTVLALPFINRSSHIREEDFQNLSILAGQKGSNSIALDSLKLVGEFKKDLFIGAREDSVSGKNDVFSHVGLTYSVLYFTFKETEFIRDSISTHRKPDMKNPLYARCVNEKGLNPNKIHLSAMTEIDPDNTNSTFNSVEADDKLLDNLHKLSKYFNKNFAAELICGQVEGALQLAPYKNKNLYEQLINLTDRMTS